MSKPVHFERLDDGQWLASCRKCPKRFGAHNIGRVRWATTLHVTAPSFREVNAWWKQHRETPIHQASAGPKRPPTEEELLLQRIFGDPSGADRVASDEETQRIADAVIDRRQELLRRLAD